MPAVHLTSISGILLDSPPASSLRYGAPLSSPHPHRTRNKRRAHPGPDANLRHRWLSFRAQAAGVEESTRSDARLTTYLQEVTVLVGEGPDDNVMNHLAVRMPNRRIFA